MAIFKPPGYQKIASYLFSMVPLPLLKACVGGMPLIGYCHLVSDEEVEHIKHLYKYKNVKTFKKDLDYFLKRWKPISLFDLLSFIKASRRVPEGSFLLTVDDGLREAHDVIAPILLEKGVPAVFFLSSGFLDNQQLAYDHKASLIVETLRRKEVPDLVKKVRGILEKKTGGNSDYKAYVMGLGYHDAYVLDQIGEVLGLDFGDYLKSKRPYLTTDDARRLVKQGFGLGAHGIDHPVYFDLSFEEQLRQTIISIRFVRDKFALDYGAFAFPHSDRGVTSEFFSEMEKMGLVDISFGGGGILEDAIKFHFQRFSLEKPLVSAEKLVSFQVARRVYRRIRGIRRIER